jgi:hypothetical protein
LRGHDDVIACAHSLRRFGGIIGAMGQSGIEGKKAASRQEQEEPERMIDSQMM